MMLKKIFTVCFFFFTTACGYEATLSKKNSKNYNFSISSIKYEGDRDVNLKIKQKFSNYVLNEQDKKFRLNVKSEAIKVVLAKDVQGNPTSFKNTTIVNVEVFIENNLKNRLKVEKVFKYNNNSNKYDLKRYEKELKTNLAETIADELIFKLSNIQ